MNDFNFNKEIDAIKDITDDKRIDIHQIPGIVGTGITLSKVTGIDTKKKGENECQIVVYLDNKDNKDNKDVSLSKIPKYINNIRVTKQITGSGIAAAFNQRVRPLRGGSSIYNYRQKLRGSIAGFPIDTSIEGNGRRVLLSANHVLALDWGCIRDGKKGDPILQPAMCEYYPEYRNIYNLNLAYRKGGKYPDDIAARLERWLRVVSDSEGYNLIDGGCAILEPGVDYSDNNMCNYAVNGWIDPIPGTFVKISSKTLECRQGYVYEPYIHSVDASIMLHFGYKNRNEFNNAIFRDQIIIAGTEKFPSAVLGDSGGLVVHSDTNSAIGMIIGTMGSDRVFEYGPIRNNCYSINIQNQYAKYECSNNPLPSGFSIANKIENLQNLLQVSFGQKQPIPTPQISHRKCIVNFCYPMCLLVRGEGINECFGDSECEKKRVMITLKAGPVEAQGGVTHIISILPNISVIPPPLIGNYRTSYRGNVYSGYEYTMRCFELGDKIQILTGLPLSREWLNIPDICYDGKCYPAIIGEQPHEMILEKNNYIIEVVFKRSTFF